MGIVSGTFNHRTEKTSCTDAFERNNAIIHPEKPKTRTLSRPGLVGEGGFAFLRKSHGGCKAPPGPCQEPPFESTFQMPKRRKASHPLGCLAFLVGEGGFEDD
jgi:hypothetical protein